MLLFLPAQILNNRMQIVMETSCVLLANQPDFFNNRIANHNQSSINSSGVQIIGHA